MKKNGFTIIELLAVIVILAIIALIATPIVINIIEDSKQSSVKVSAENYLNALELAIIQKNLQESYNPTKCVIENGILTCGETVLDVDINGQTPSCGYIILEDGKLKVSALNIEGYKVQNKKGKVTIKKSTDCYPGFDNGEVVYFDVVKGTGCTVDDYNLSYDSEKNDYLNSYTGYNGYVNKDMDGNILEKMNGQNGCLKFFAYLSEDGANAKLLLDHNISYAYWKYFVGSSSLRNGPVDSLKSLYEDTKEWNGTITLDNYIYKYYKDNSPAYTITYESIPSYEGAETPFKAGLISANEMARITGNNDWDESLGLLGFYFETNDLNTKEVACTDKDEKTKCEYGWLYERLSSCKDYGCVNNILIAPDTYQYTYWTATGSGWSGATSARQVDWTGRITRADISHKAGVRPVIKVLKDSIL